MKKTFRNFLAVSLCFLMILGTVAIGGTGIMAFADEASYSVGDIIEYGNYPQSEVTDSDIISELSAIADNNSYWTNCGYYTGSGSNDDGNMIASDFMRYTDVVYGSDRYRGVIFDHYRPQLTSQTSDKNYSYQSINGYEKGTVYWFKYEPVEWEVLDPDTGLVIAKTILDAQAFNNYVLEDGTDDNGGVYYWGDSEETYYANDYENSSVRSWLNSSFYNTAFTTGQKSFIASTELDGNEALNDKIYLLSYDDALNSSYGLSTDSARTAEGSSYAKAQGLTVAYTDSSADENYGCSGWQLRTPDSNYRDCAYVSEYSGNISDGKLVLYVNGIRPAMNLNLTADGFEDVDQSTGNRTGCIIEYGTYPQTEVTDENTISALNTLAGDNSGWTSFGYCTGNGREDDGKIESSDYMRYTDVIYGGGKYRGIVIDSLRPKYTYDGHSEESSNQDNNGYTAGVYWFKYEPVKWRILDPDTGLVMAETILDAQPFNNYIIMKGQDVHANNLYWGDPDCTYYANNYKESSVRAWLNDDFYNTAFTAEEKSFINSTELEDNDSVSDKILLLSSDDISDDAYGFDTDGSRNDFARRTHGSDYAKAQGMTVLKTEYYLTGCKGNSCWLLRTSSAEDSDGAYTVTYDGSVNTYVETAGIEGIRPVMSLNLKADEYKSVASSTGIEKGDTVYYGTYPQSQVTDADLIASLNNAGGIWKSYNYYSGTGDYVNTEMTASDYMRYKDVVYEGTAYRAVTFDTYRPCYTYNESSDEADDFTFQSKNGYTAGNVYWFKYEPLQWRVIDPDEGTVMCSTIIDSQAYNNYFIATFEADPYNSYTGWGNSAETVYANNYAESSVREWLNSDFYNTAFSADEKNNIIPTGLENNAFSDSYSAYASVLTFDRIFILSYDDVMNSDYGFSALTSSEDSARILNGSDYAMAQGLSKQSGTASAMWMLRTPAKDSGNIFTCVNGNVVSSELTGTAFTGFGIVPAMSLKTITNDYTGREAVISNGDGTHTVYDKTGAAVSTGKCTYTSETTEGTSKVCPVCTYTCSECGYSYNQVMHTPGDETYEYIVPATATEEGYCDAVVYCTVCGEELSRYSDVIPVGFISASCDKTAMARNQTATWTVTTTTDVTWLRLSGTYTTAAGDVKTLSAYYKYTNASSDADGVRTWTLPKALSYTVSDDSVTETWKIEYKLSGSSIWNTALTKAGIWSSSIVIYRNAGLMPKQTEASETAPYSLISVDTDKTAASAGDKIIFTVKTTSDVTKVRIGYNYTADGAEKTKAVTYQTTSSNQTHIDNGDGTMTWTITYKVPATAAGETDFNIQVRGTAWGAAKSKTITVA